MRLVSRWEPLRLAVVALLVVSAGAADSALTEVSLARATGYWAINFTALLIWMLAWAHASRNWARRAFTDEFIRSWWGLLAGASLVPIFLIGPWVRG
jgi:hypothetical protein